MRRKIFAGEVIRRRREALGLTQAAMSKRLGISPTYINQIENNQRPLTAVLLMEVARTLRLGIEELSTEGPERLAAYLREMLADPVFSDAAVSPRELQQLALSAPNLARAVLELHASYRRSEERFQSLDDLIQSREAAEVGRGRPFAFDEVRDFFHLIGNYVDALDRSAETLAETLWSEAGVSLERLIHHVEATLATGVSIVPAQDLGGLLSRYDPTGRVLLLSRAESLPTQKFLVACHVASRAVGEMIEDEVRKAAFRASASGSIARLALANYFAGALLLPYSRFHDEALGCRHDVERLAATFGASFEQVCHRLSTLQRPGREGVPFYFLRVDRAGNITKRHSATRLQFARYGGACPLWNIHEAFEAPDKMLVQVAEMPDGVRYLSVAKAIVKGGGAFGAPQRRYALGFGCELTHARALVYSDAVDLRAPAQVAPIGINCRLCERPDCHQRAMPPYDVPIVVPQGRRGALPYALDRDGSASTTSTRPV